MTSREIENDGYMDVAHNSSVDIDDDESVPASKRSASYRNSTELAQDKFTSIVEDVQSSRMQKKLNTAFENSGDKKPRMTMVATEIVQAFNEEKTKLRRYQIMGAIVVALLAISIAANLGTSWYAVEAQKETKTTTGFSVPSTLAVSDNNSTTSSSTKQPHLLTDMDGNVLRTDRSLDKMKLTSELPDDAWSNMEELHIKGTGGAIHFKVLGWARFNGVSTRCGTVVVVYTVAGQVQFDGTAMTFSNDVAGAFTRAGFPVSARRRQAQNQDHSGYTLTGIQEVFGAFKFVSQLNVSNLSCGDDKPNITNNPFAGGVDDFYLVENHLYLCDDEGRPACPSSEYTVTILGQSYYKRIKSTRAKLLGSQWVWVARTEVPEAAYASEYGTTANTLVEMSNGTHVKSYTEYSYLNGSEVPLQCFWPRTLEKATNPAPFRTNVDEQLEYTMHFVGYDVVNGEYVRHYTLTLDDQSMFDNTPNLTVSKGTLSTNLFMSYENDRLYSLGMFAPLKYTTYESVELNPDPTTLQGSDMPKLPENEAEIEEWLANTTCPIDTLADGLGSDEEFLAQVADTILVPDIARFNSINLYTDEDAERVRLQRAMIISENDAQTTQPSNNTNSSDGGRHRRGGTSASRLSLSMAQFRANGGEVTANAVCKYPDVCDKVFADFSHHCCASSKTCATCIDMLNLPIEHDQDTRSTSNSLLVTNNKSTEVERSRRNHKPPLGFTWYCAESEFKEIAYERLWPGSPFKAYWAKCMVPDGYYWKTKVHYHYRTCSRPPYRKYGCKACVGPFWYGRPYYREQKCWTKRPPTVATLKGGIKANECFACGNPYADITADLYVQLSTQKLQWVAPADTRAGGELTLLAKFNILGKSFNISVHGGLSLSFDIYSGEMVLKAYAGLKVGCCGFSGKLTFYAAWSPVFPLPRRPNNYGIAVEMCFAWLCAELDFPVI